MKLFGMVMLAMFGVAGCVVDAAYVGVGDPQSGQTFDGTLDVGAKLDAPVEQHRRRALEFPRDLRPVGKPRTMDPVIEIVHLSITPGREEEFEQAMRVVHHIAVDAAGSRTVKLARGVESPSKFVLLIEWDSKEAHIEFTKTVPFQDYRAALRSCVAEPPQMEHFRDIG